MNSGALRRMALRAICPVVDTTHYKRYKLGERERK